MITASWRSIRRVLALLAVLAWPAAGYAQQAIVTGTVTDSSGGVLPGVTITVVHEETGNTFEGVTDAQGAFRIPVRVGAHRITASLAGFQTATRTGLQLLLNQTLAVPLQLGPATVAETVTVTGEAPLVDTTDSTVGANIDPRQVQDLPINGRNWMDLTLLAPGARRNEGGGLVQNRQGYAQTNVDGQQITTNYHTTPDSEQPQMSRDAIAEFQVVANRFDATQGRSTGMVVNAITKSGTNALTGTFGGYFRNDRLNAQDFILQRVLPVLESAVQHHRWWSPDSRPAALLRELRVRARAAHVQREQCVRVPESGHHISQKAAHCYRARRLAADAPDATGCPCDAVPHGFLQQRQPHQPGWRHPWTHRAPGLRHLDAGLRDQRR